MHARANHHTPSLRIRREPLPGHHPPRARLAVRFLVERLEVRCRLHFEFENGEAARVGGEDEVVCGKTLAFVSRKG